MIYKLPSEHRFVSLILYWRSLAPRRVVEMKLDLMADIPGRYTAPASRAYLYYTAEQKQWTDPAVVEVTREQRTKLEGHLDGSRGVTFHLAEGLNSP